MTRPASRDLLARTILMALLPVVTLLLFSQLPPSLLPAAPIAVVVAGIFAGAYLLVRLQRVVHHERDRG